MPKSRSPAHRKGDMSRAPIAHLDDALGWCGRLQPAGCERQAQRTFLEGCCRLMVWFAWRACGACRCMHMRVRMLNDAHLHALHTIYTYKHKQRQCMRSLRRGIRVTCGGARAATGQPHTAHDPPNHRRSTTTLNHQRSTDHAQPPTERHTPNHRRSTTTLNH